MKLWRALPTPTNSGCASRAFAPPPTPPARKWSAKWPTSSASPASNCSGGFTPPVAQTSFCAVLPLARTDPTGALALSSETSRVAPRQPRKNLSLHFHSATPRCRHIPEFCLRYGQSARAPTFPKRSHAGNHRQLQACAHFPSLQIRHLLLLDHLRT